MVTKSDFRKWQRDHSNFITPHIKKLEQSGNYFIELSEGIGFEHKPLYGVSIIHWGGDKFYSIGHKHENLSKLFHNYAEALAYFNKIKKEI